MRPGTGLELALLSLELAWNWPCKASSYGGTGNPVVTVVAVGAGTFNVRLCNLPGATSTGSVNTANNQAETVTSTNTGAALDAAVSFNFATINV